MSAGAEWQVTGGDLPDGVLTMQMVDGLAQRYGQHPDAIIGGDSYIFRLINTLSAFGLLNPGSKPEFESYDDDPLAGFSQTLG